MKADEEHISFLDHIRGAAILLVFFYHSVFNSFWHFKQPVQLNWNGWARDFHADPQLLAVLPGTLGWIGVAIFFVVSGFCIHLSHERSRQKSFKVFFVRRFFRIYPPYLVAMLAAAAVYPLVHAEAKDFGGQIVSHIFLYFNFAEAYRSGLNASLWSIAVEAQLYLLYPILLWLVFRLGWYRSLWVTAVIELGLRVGESIYLIVHPEFESTVYFVWWFTDFPLAFWFSWSVGAALAEAFLKKQPLPFLRTPGFLWPLLFFVCYAIRPLSPFCFALVALSTVQLISYLLSRPAIVFPTHGFWGWTLGHLRWTGIVSYSAYLLHGPILSQVPRVVSILLRGHELQPLMIFVACLLTWPLVFGLAYLFYRFVEMPSIAWGKKIIQGMREPAAATIPATALPEKS